MNNLLITGCSGFVGSNLSEFLKNNNFNIFCLSLRDSQWENRISNDILGYIHLAGKAHDTSNKSNSEEYYKINRDLTISIFNKFLKSSAKDFFYFSSVKAVADTLNSKLFEDVNPQPKTPYGKSKLEAESYLMEKVLPVGKRLFIIRPCMIHGPGNKGNLNLLFEVVKKGIPWPLGSFYNERSFLSIDNLNFLILKMITDSNLKSGIYNFSDDGTLSTNELVELISNSLGKRSRILNINKNIVQSIAKIGDKLKLPLNSERLKKLTESYIVSNDKIKNELNIDKLPLNIRQGIQITIDSFKFKSV